MKRHHRSEGVAATTQQPLDQFKPFKDRSVQTITVACPICGAEAGTPCVKADGSPTYRHRERRRLALRGERA